MKIYDISIPIDNQTIVYPKNPEIEIKPFAEMPEASSNLTKITFGSHTGTHIDAPSHTILNGESIDIYNLENFIGPCKVFDFSDLKAGELIKISDFEKAAETGINIEAGDRVLVKTINSIRGFDVFYEDFVALDGDCADFLANQKIALFGIDYLSVKQRGSTDNRAHNSLLSQKIPIIEGLNLKEVSGGSYDLFCPPLKITGVDGAPARAILIEK